MATNHLMVDLETLGTTADACILSIGAVKFDLDSETIEDDGFYASTSIASNLEHGRRIQEDTLLWWMGQSKEAQGVFHEPKQTLLEAFTGLTAWIGEGDYHVWSNGADFDLPILLHAYAVSLGMKAPWKFYKHRCYRTFKNLPGAKNVKLPMCGVKHNALFDAVHQAQTAQAIQAKLFHNNHAFKVKEKT